MLEVAPTLVRVFHAPPFARHCMSQEVIGAPPSLGAAGRVKSICEALTTVGTGAAGAWGTVTG